MKSLFAKTAMFAMFVLLAASAASTGEGVPAAVHYIPHDQAAAVMAKGGPIMSDPGLVVLANRREAGAVEYHEHTNHIFIMVDGEATFITIPAKTPHWWKEIPSKTVGYYAINIESK
jgi:hypothetical protein